MKTNYFILGENGQEQPAYMHEDGTLVSYWDNLPTLLIQEPGCTPEEISHELAKELGY